MNYFCVSCNQVWMAMHPGPRNSAKGDCERSSSMLFVTSYTMTLENELGSGRLLFQENREQLPLSFHFALIMYVCVIYAGYYNMMIIYNSPCCISNIPHRLWNRLWRVAPSNSFTRVLESVLQIFLQLCLLHISVSTRILSTDSCVQPLKIWSIFLNKLDELIPNLIEKLWWWEMLGCRLEKLCLKIMTTHFWVV